MEDILTILGGGAVIAFIIWALINSGIKCPNCGDTQWKEGVSRSLIREEIGQEPRTYTDTEKDKDGNVIRTTERTQVVQIMRRSFDARYRCASCGTIISRNEHESSDRF